MLVLSSIPSSSPQFRVIHCTQSHCFFMFLLLWKNFSPFFFFFIMLTYLENMGQLIQSQFLNLGSWDHVFSRFDSLMPVWLENYKRATGSFSGVQCQWYHHQGTQSYVHTQEKLLHICLPGDTEYIQNNHHKLEVILPF